MQKLFICLKRWKGLVSINSDNQDYNIARIKGNNERIIEVVYTGTNCGTQLCNLAYVYVVQVKRLTCSTMPYFSIFIR